MMVIATYSSFRSFCSYIPLLSTHLLPFFSNQRGEYKLYVKWLLPFVAYEGKGFQKTASAFNKFSSAKQKG